MSDKVNTTSESQVPCSRYHRNAYRFVYEALQHTQRNLGRGLDSEQDEKSAHISGPELLEGVKELGKRQFGLLATTVFDQWGIKSTDDFGHLVYELIERGEMRKTDRDQLSDFFSVYSFTEEFDQKYEIDTSSAYE